MVNVPSTVKLAAAVATTVLEVVNVPAMVKGLAGKVLVVPVLRSRFP